MTNRNYYTTPSNYATDYTRFSGLISNYSFDGHSTMADIASQIVSDWKFDERCRKNALNRDKAKTYKKGTN